MIQIEKVSKVYRTQENEFVSAVAEVTFGVRENEFVTLVGPSGCGKSTLLKLVSGLIPVTGGTIHVREKLVREPFSDVGFVFQHPVLLPWRTVLGNILFSIEMLGKKEEEFTGRARDLIKL